MKTTHTGIFDTIDEYLVLRKFWSQFMADGKHVKQSKLIQSSMNGGHIERKSPLTYEHHLIYLICTQKRGIDYIRCMTGRTIFNAWDNTESKYLLPSLKDMFRDVTKSEIIRIIRDFDGAIHESHAPIIYDELRRFYNRRRGKNHEI